VYVDAAGGVFVEALLEEREEAVLVEAFEEKSFHRTASIALECAHVTPLPHSTRMLAPAGPASPALSESIAEARRAWPGLEVDSEGFASHLASKVGDGDGARVRVTDLFLAYACSVREPRAIAQFEATYFDEVEVARRRFDSLPIADDVAQRVRQKLFLNAPPALAGYAGTGDLRAWVRAAVLHMLINIATREARERPTENDFFDAVVDTSADAEAAYLKRACHAEFEESFSLAMSRLEPREKTLLRYAFVDGLSVDQIGAVFQVHRATAARWVAKARERLVSEARADLMTRLQVDEQEASSILRAAMSRMGTTLLRRFG
jgi:RNA polymerase sigma-70 factor, ECF subfamily